MSFYLSKGHLEKLEKRTGLFSAASGSHGDTIRLDFENVPSIIMCTYVEIVESCFYGTLAQCLVTDGSTQVPVIIDFIPNMGSSSQKRIELQEGSIILLKEIEYQLYRYFGINHPKCPATIDNFKKIMLISNFNFLGIESSLIVNDQNADTILTDSINDSTVAIDQNIQKESVKSSNSLLSVPVQKQASLPLQPSMIHAINELSVRLSKINFKVKVFIEKVSEIMEFKRQNKEDGKCVRFKVTDNTGSIELVAFHSDCDRVSLLQFKSWYIISNITITKGDLRHKIWPSEVNLCDLVVNFNTQFILTEDPFIEHVIEKENEKIKEKEKPTKTNVEFADQITSIDKLIFIKEKQKTNVFGIICSKENLFVKEFKDGRTIEIRNASIVDTTNTRVSIAFWGKQAKNFDYQIGTVLLLVGVEVSSYGGCSLSVTKSTRVSNITDQIRPEVVTLKQWFSTISNRRKETVSVNHFLAIEKKGSKRTATTGQDEKDDSEVESSSQSMKLMKLKDGQ